MTPILEQMFKIALCSGHFCHILESSFKMTEDDQKTKALANEAILKY